MCLQAVFISVHFLFSNFSHKNKFAISLCACLHRYFTARKNSCCRKLPVHMHTFQIKTNSISAPGNKIKGHDFVRRKESILAKQPVKSGKLNSCQPDGWHHHSIFRLKILLEKAFWRKLFCFAGLYLFLLFILIIGNLTELPSELHYQVSQGKDLSFHL